MEIENVLPYATEQARSSALHGPAHGARVASFGNHLSQSTPATKDILGAQMGRR